MLNTQDVSTSKRWVRKATIGNGRCQDIDLRIVHLTENDLDFFAVRAPVGVNYTKTFTDGRYVDLLDLTQIYSNGFAVATKCPNIIGEVSALELGACILRNFLVGTVRV